MLKYLFMAAPLIANSARPSVAQRAGRALGAAIMFAALILTLIAFGIWMAELYSAEIALLCIAGMLFIFGLVVYMRAGKKRAKPRVPAASADPVAALLPDNIANDPTLKSALDTVAKNPATAIGVATLIGVALSRAISK